MKSRLGLVCSGLNIKHTTNKSFRLKSLSFEKLLQTMQINLDGLKNLIPYCANNDITIFRLGNAIVPFASHPEFKQQWWSELEPLFKDTAKIIAPYNVRLSIHPGQFIQLGSKSEKVVESSLRELEYCHKVLELLGSKDGVITLHIGGRAGDAKETMQRFFEVFSQNEWLKKYLALENDENNFNSKETLELCNRCGIPHIFDIFHHSINPSEVSWSQIKKSWKGKRAKVHISSQGDGPVGMHAKFITKEDYKALQEFLGDDFGEVDIMIEAKAKEEAIKLLGGYDG